LRIVAGSEQPAIAFPRTRGLWQSAVLMLSVLVAAALALVLVPPFMADLELGRAIESADAAYLDEAEAHLQRAVAWTPGNATLHRMLGDVYTSMMLFRRPQDVYLGKALASYRQAARLTPLDSLTFTRMGWAHLYGGEAAAAEQAFLQARSLDPNNPYINYSLGTSYLWQKKLANARTEFEIAQRYYPAAPEIKASLEEVDRLVTAR